MLEDISKIEFGIPEQTFSLFNKSDAHCFRVQYRVNGEEGFHHMMRSTNMKFFNNVVSVITSEEEKIESLKAIADTVGVALESKNLKCGLASWKRKDLSHRQELLTQWKCLA